MPFKNHDIDERSSTTYKDRMIWVRMGESRERMKVMQWGNFESEVVWGGPTMIG